MHSDMHSFFKCATPANIFATATKPSPLAHFQDDVESFVLGLQNHILTSESGRRRPVFFTFDFDMCFPSQRHALSEHLNFQKWSENGVFCTVWLRAAGACTSQLAKVLPYWFFFKHFDFDLCFVPQWHAFCFHKYLDVEASFDSTSILKHVSCHSDLATWVRTPCFNKPTCRLLHRKNTVCRGFSSRTCVYFFVFFSRDLLSSSLLFFDSFQLWFSIVHIVGFDFQTSSDQCKSCRDSLARLNRHELQAQAHLRPKDAAKEREKAARAEEAEKAGQGQGSNLVQGICNCRFGSPGGEQETQLPRAQLPKRRRRNKRPGLREFTQDFGHYWSYCSTFNDYGIVGIWFKSAGNCGTSKIETKPENMSSLRIEAWHDCCHLLY